MELPAAAFYPAGANCVLPPASDEQYRIRVVVSGYGYLIPAGGGGPLLLCPGTALLIRPGETPHPELLTEAKLLDLSFRGETAELMRSNAPAFAVHNPLVISPDALDLAVRLGEEIIEEQRQRNPGYALAVLEKILAAERLVFRHGRELSVPELKTAAALQFLAENYSRDITLTDLAGATGMSVSHFRRSFRRIMGSSPIDFLLDLRLRKAAALLTHSSLRIGAAAAESGFSDANYFSRIFTRRMGQTPREWRRRSGKN